jgi:hypothetical protein
MGSYVKGILGNFTGKVGTVIGSNWKSINYMKSLPGKRKGMPSSAQVEQQLKFALMLRFHEAFQSLLTLTFANSSKNMTPANYAMGHNIKLAIKGDYPEFSIDYHKVLLSKGKLQPVGGASVEGNGAGKIKFSWIDNSDEYGFSNTDDKAVLIAYCAETNRAVYSLNNGTRSLGTAIMNVSLFGGKDVETWIAFVNEDGTKFSDSVYLGNVMVE